MTTIARALAAPAPSLRSSEFEAAPLALALDMAIAGIERRYGRRTAYGVALDLEYPGFKY
ncbi:MAG: hypothetical protein V4857_16945 [Pseudomonadota bacterium]